MQTVITWTRYDGTPETLPEEDRGVFVHEAGARCAHAAIAYRRRVYDKEMWVSIFSEWPIQSGDGWAPWPAAPQGVE